MRICYLFICLLCLQVAAAQKNKPLGTLDLREALDRKLLSIQVEGTGGHQGESLKMVCKNLAGRFFRLRIPLGQLMEPGDSALQTLVVAEEQMLAVSAKMPAEANLKTFCTQAGDLSPTAGARFSVGAMGPTNLCKLLEFIVQSGKLESDDAQSAVWCVSGKRHALGSIDDPELARFTADLLGKELPGYKVRHQTVTEVPGRPADMGKALVVEGNFAYYLEKDEKVLMVLLNSEGKQIKQISKEENMKAGEHRSGLRLEVYNLDPGKYVLRMQTKAGRVIKDFPVEF